MAKKRKTKVLEGEMKNLKRVDFSLLASDAQDVSLAGDFNGWDKNSHLLKKDSNGMWKINIDLMPGSYEYRFLVDGEWKNDPNCTTFAPNPFGGNNCIITLE